MTGISLGTATITFTDTVTTCFVSTTFTVINCFDEVPTMSKKQPVDIFPSPATDVLNIKMTKGAYSSFIITNETGQMIQQGVITDTQTKVNVKAWPPGIYNITFNGDDGTTAKKFMKE